MPCGLKALRQRTESLFVTKKWFNSSICRPSITSVKFYSS